MLLAHRAKAPASLPLLHHSKPQLRAAAHQHTATGRRRASIVAFKNDSAQRGMEFNNNNGTVCIPCSHLELLGLSQGSSPEDVKAAYEARVSSSTQVRPLGSTLATAQG